MEHSILSGITAYKMEGCYPWHMPGHKRRLNTIFPEQVINPFLIDVTEVDGLDEFHQPEGIIKDAFEKAAAIYGSHKSYYLVNGSTCGIMASISAVCKQGDSLIVARNCHKSVYNAIRLLKLRPVYVVPEWNDELEMFGAVAPEEIKNAIKNNPEAKAVIMVSPTYEGVVSDIEKIAKIVHKASIPLIVDEAHGAHFEFMANVNETISTTNYQNVPDPAIRLGADIVIESLHKTLPALTQCAILHENSKLVNHKKLEEFLSIYQSSSPSYVFMAATEACIEKMDHERDGQFILYKALLSDYRKRFSQLKHIHLVEESDFRKQGIYDYDDGKLVFSVQNCGFRQGDTIEIVTGVKFGKILQKEYGQMMEMAGGTYVVAMTSLADSKEAFEGLYQALETIDGQLTYLPMTTDTTLYKTLPESGMRIDEAMEYEHENVTFEQAVGRISGAYIYIYPPGIPIITPGEVISEELLEGIRRAKEKELNLKGIVQGLEDHITVVKEYR